MAFYKVVYAYAIIVTQLLLEQFDTLPKQCRFIEHMHERVWLKIILTNYSYENLDNFSLIWLLYMLRY